MEKSELVVVATPSPISPLKTTLGLSVIHSMPGAQCRAHQTSPVTHPPTFACDPYNNTPVIGDGWETETFKTTTVHVSNRSTFSISRSGKILALEGQVIDVILVFRRRLYRSLNSRAQLFHLPPPAPSAVPIRVSF